MSFNFKRAVSIFQVVLLLSTLLYAQGERVLTLEESLKEAFDNNPDLRVAEKELAKTEAGVWEAYSVLLPQVNGTASVQHAWDIQTNTIPNFIKLMMPPDIGNILPSFADMPDYIDIAFGLENTFYYGASLQQPLFLGGAGVAGVKMANAAKRAAQQNLKSVKQNLIYNTADAFYTCLLARELVSVQEEALQQSEANFNVVSKKYDVGSASGFDKMRAEVEVANLKPQVITARNQYKTALTRLRTVLGLPRDAKISVDGELNFVQDEFGKDLEDVQQMALQYRPELRAIQEQEYITKKGVTVARSNFMPRVVFQSDYSYMAYRNDWNVGDADFSKGFTSSISLQIPLFTGFKNSKSYQKAKLDHRIMIDTEKQVTDGIMAEVEVAYNTFGEAFEKYTAASQSVDLAQEALRLANMMYDEGANTQLDVLNSQLALTQSKLNYVTSIYDYQMSRYRLHKVTGTLQGLLN